MIIVSPPVYGGISSRIATAIVSSTIEILLICSNKNEQREPLEDIEHPKFVSKTTKHPKLPTDHRSSIATKIRNLRDITAPLYPLLTSKSYVVDREAVRLEYMMELGVDFKHALLVSLTVSGWWALVGGVSRTLQGTGTSRYLHSYYTLLVFTVVTIMHTRHSHLWDMILAVPGT
jgi:hypothetical protein